MDKNFNERRYMMSKKMGGIELLTGLCLAMVVVAGCTSSRVNLVDAERVTVERMASKRHVRIENVNVYQEEGDLVVSGRVKHKSINLRPAKGHIDIAMVSPNGEVIETDSVTQTPPVGSRRTKQSRGFHFETRFSIVPPEGSTVRIAFHPEKYGPETHNDCEKNAAANI